jgi:hypothetical protein
MDASELLERQHRRVFKQIGQLGGRGVGRLFALHELIDSVLAHISVVEALAKVTVLRGGITPDKVAFDDDTRNALLELAQSRADEAWFATARGRLENAFRARVTCVRSTLLPHVAASFDRRERRVLGVWLAQHYLERRRGETQQ